MPKGAGSADPMHCSAVPSSTIASPRGSGAGQDLRVSIPTPEEMRARPRNACGRPRPERKTSVYGRAERASSPPKPYRVLSRTEAGGPPLHAARAEGMGLPPMPMPGGMPSADGAMPMPGGNGCIPMPGGMPVVPGGDLPDDDGGCTSAANGRPGPPPLPGRRCGSFSEESESLSVETPHATDGTGAYSKSAYDQAFWSAAALKMVTLGLLPNPIPDPHLDPHPNPIQVRRRCRPPRRAARAGPDQVRPPAVLPAPPHSLSSQPVQPASHPLLPARPASLFSQPVQLAQNTIFLRRVQIARAVLLSRAHRLRQPPTRQRQRSRPPAAARSPLGSPTPLKCSAAPALSRRARPAARPRQGGDAPRAS